MRPENHLKRGTKRGTPILALGPYKRNSRMKMTNKHKLVVDSDSFDESTHGLEVNERALATGGAQRNVYRLAAHGSASSTED